MVVARGKRTTKRKQEMTGWVIWIRSWCNEMKQKIRCCQSRLNSLPHPQSISNWFVSTSDRAHLVVVGERRWDVVSLPPWPSCCRWLQLPSYRRACSSPGFYFLCSFCCIFVFNECYLRRFCGCPFVLGVVYRNTFVGSILQAIRQGSVKNCLDRKCRENDVKRTLANWITKIWVEAVEYSIIKNFSSCFTKFSRKIRIRKILLFYHYAYLY